MRVDEHLLCSTYHHKTQEVGHKSPTTSVLLHQLPLVGQDPSEANRLRTSRVHSGANRGVEGG